MKLIEILREIGETTAQPYPLTLKDESVYYAIWEFKTDSDLQYQVIIGKDYTDSNEEAVTYTVSFGVYDRGTIDFEAEVNDPKNLYRVMATVIKAIKDTMADEINQTELPVSRIIIEPTKREIPTPDSPMPVYDKSDTRRADLYMKYIQKQMPAGAKVQTTADKSQIRIDLPTE